MVYKWQMVNYMASLKVAEIKNTSFSKLPEHYKTMSYLDWCKYYNKLSKKLLSKWYFGK